MTQDESTDRTPQAGLDMFARSGLFLCIFMSGAAVMTYELLAIRILQRDFGGAIDVWASEIAVCLAGLAVGYYVGGRLADRYQSLRLMSAAVFAGGLFGLLIEWLASATGSRLLSIDFGLQFHPLIAAGVSTFLPIAFLGSVLPQAIRLQVGRLDKVGSAVGFVSTVSTIGSIFGILITAMVLMKYWGVDRILTGTSILLMVLAALTGSVGKKGVAATIFFLAFAPVSAFSQTTLFETYSAYHHIMVRDVGDTRMLLFDNDRQTLMSIRNPNEGGFEYATYFHVPIMFDPTISRVLFIGLGGGTGPKSFFRAYPSMQIEVAEIDPVVVQVARRYFALPQDPRLKITEMDGRVYLNRARGTFGAIMMDAYGSGPRGAYLPYHMATREFFNIVWRKLDNGGCLFYNAVGEFGGMNDDVVRHLLVTLESVFQAVYAFRARTSINTVFVAVKIDTRTLREDGTRDGKGWPEGPWMDHLLSAQNLRALAQRMPPLFKASARGLDRLVTQFSPVISAPRTGILLTDDFAPVDIAPRRR